MGELLIGPQISSQREREQRRVDVADALLEKLNTTEETARHYAGVFAALRRIGRPIPQNDMWIAACALEHDLTLHTTDAHFSEVPGLKLVLLPKSN